MKNNCQLIATAFESAGRAHLTIQTVPLVEGKGLEEHKAKLTETLSLLREATTAVQELTNRASGMKPPKEGE